MKMQLTYFKAVGPLKPQKKDFSEVITIHWLSDVRQKAQRKKLVTEIVFSTG